MSNNIVLKRGLDIPIKGEAARETVKMIKPDIIAMKPTDFKGLTPRILVREGDRVSAGSPVMADKNCPDILFTSPVSGTVAGVVRGDKRKLLEVRIKVDDEQSYVDFGVQDAASMSADDVKSLLLRSGLWASLIQRPYGVLADPQVRPRAVFISSFSTAPLAADTDYVLGDCLKDLQAAVNALGKLTDGGVHVSLAAGKGSGSQFGRLENVVFHSISGKHPAGNVGVQISNIAPIRKGETVWTVSPLLLAAIGKLLNTGKLCLARKVAVTGPEAVNPAYVDAVPGICMTELADFCDNSANDVRFISGDVLSGKNVGAEGYLGFFDNQVSLLHEGTEREWFGWIKPFRFEHFSSSRSYFSWLCPNKKYDMNTNTHGGERTFMMSDVYGKVLPMDIFPVYLVKACLAGNLDDMEKFGIYEVLPEDLATCEFVDPSKNDIQSIIESGIDRMIKEMA